MKKIIYAGVILVGFMFMGGIRAQADTIKDTDGNPVVSHHKYIIEAVVPGQGSRYWCNTYSSLNYHWIKLTTDYQNTASFYSFPAANGELQEGNPYKIYADSAPGYLWYRSTNLLYPYGGVYIDDTKSGSINWTFHLAQDGKSYNFTADDGPIYADFYASSSLVVSLYDVSYNFTVQFHRVN